MEKLIPIGILVVFIGIFIIIAGSLFSGTEKTNVAVGGFIGPIPFGWANDKRLMWVVVGIMIAMAILWALFNSKRWLG